jgi:hypothetical protein
MGGKSSPNYQGAAIAQGEANREVVRDQTFANRPEQFTPWGSTSWNPYQTTDPATGQAVTGWQQMTQLTPELQDILNKQIAIQGGRSDLAGQMTGRLAGEFGNSMDWSGLNPMGNVPTNQFTLPEELQRSVNYNGAPGISDPTQLRQRAEDMEYNKATSRLDPQFQQQRQALEIKLRNQGLGPEDEAYKTQMSGLDMQETDARNQAMFSASAAGRSEAGQLFGQDVTRRSTATNEIDRSADFFNRSGAQAFGQASQANQANFGQAMQSSQYANALRQQQITEAMQKRGFSLNEINALLSGQQVNTPQMPSFTGAQAAQPAPVYQAATDQGNFNQMLLQGGMAGAGSLAGMFFGG